MTHDEREEALEKIAHLFNCGLSNAEVAKAFTSEELVDFIRHLMENRPEEISEALAQMYQDELGRMHP